ncbi:abortive infection protein [Saccharothrix australiensis]|nr:abortive infection protein [Saccharothrix australiensis]
MGSSLVHKGINYTVGLNYVGEGCTRDIWRTELVEQELRVIRDELHCTAVNVYGTEVPRLVEAATIALSLGLDVWLQPRLYDVDAAETLDHLADAARAAERLRARHPERVVLNVGCEYSLYTDGIIPGEDAAAKGLPLGSPRWWPVLPLFNQRLNFLLANAAAVARANFTGPLTYGAGLWEQVDWTLFDIVGSNYYRHEHNEANYRQGLRRLHRHGKPVAVLEFGCGGYRGAEKDGPRAQRLVTWDASAHTSVRESAPPRDEAAQARYLADLIELYAAEGVFAAFAFEFIQPASPHSPDPRLDLDRAGYTLVKVHAEDAELPYSSGHWEPKAAFHEVAKRYRAL